jgi:hypothetical protein
VQGMKFGWDCVQVLGWLEDSVAYGGEWMIGWSRQDLGQFERKVGGLQEILKVECLRERHVEGCAGMQGNCYG